MITQRLKVEGQAIIKDDGSHFTAWGHNYADVIEVALNGAGTGGWDTLMETTIAADLAQLHTEGSEIIRLCLQLDQFVNQDFTVKAAQVARLVRFLDLAAQNDIYVIVCGNNRWVSANQPDWLTWSSQENLWAYMTAFWTAVVSAVRLHPAVAWYNLISEPHDVAYGDFTATLTGSPASATGVLTFTGTSALDSFIGSATAANRYVALSKETAVGSGVWETEFAHFTSGVRVGSTITLSGVSFSDTSNHTSTDGHDIAYYSKGTTHISAATLAAGTPLHLSPVDVPNYNYLGGDFFALDRHYGPKVTLTPRDLTDAQIAVAYVTAMRAAIRAIDSYTPITFGAIAFNTSGSGSSWNSDNASLVALVDIWSAHLYPNGLFGSPGGIAGGSIASCITSLQATATAVGSKPLMLEEGAVPQGSTAAGIRPGVNYLLGAKRYLAGALNNFLDGTSTTRYTTTGFKAVFDLTKPYMGDSPSNDSGKTVVDFDTALASFLALGDNKPRVTGRRYLVPSGDESASLFSYTNLDSYAYSGNLVTLDSSYICQTQLGTSPGGALPQFSGTWLNQTAWSGQMKMWLNSFYKRARQVVKSVKTRAYVQSRALILQRREVSTNPLGLTNWATFQPSGSYNGVTVLLTTATDTSLLADAETVLDNRGTAVGTGATLPVVLPVVETANLPASGTVKIDDEYIAYSAKGAPAAATAVASFSSGDTQFFVTTAGSVTGTPTAGQAVFGPGIPAGTYLLASWVWGTTTWFTLSKAATSAQSGVTLTFGALPGTAASATATGNTLSGSGGSGSPLLVPCTGVPVVGQTVTYSVAGCIAAGTYVTAVSLFGGATYFITLSSNAIGTNVGGTFSFTTAKTLTVATNGRGKVMTRPVTHTNGTAVKSVLPDTTYGVQSAYVGNTAYGIDWLFAAPSVPAGRAVTDIDFFALVKVDGPFIADEETSSGTRAVSAATSTASKVLTFPSDMRGKAGFKVGAFLWDANGRITPGSKIVSMTSTTVTMDTFPTSTVSIGTNVNAHYVYPQQKATIKLTDSSGTFTYGQLTQFKGQWLAGTTYVAGDTVYDAGILYTCVPANSAYSTNSTPASLADWTAITAKTLPFAAPSGWAWVNFRFNLLSDGTTWKNAAGSTVAFFDPSNLRLYVVNGSSTGSSTDLTYSGTSTSTTSTKLNDTTTLWVTNQWVGALVAVGGKTGTVTASDATSVTVASWSGGGTPTSGAYTITMPATKYLSVASAFVNAYISGSVDPAGYAAMTVALKKSSGTVTETSVDIASGAAPGWFDAVTTDALSQADLDGLDVWVTPQATFTGTDHGSGAVGNRFWWGSYPEPSSQNLALNTAYVEVTVEETLEPVGSRVVVS